MAHVLVRQKITVSGNKFRSNEEELTLNTSGDAHRPTQRVLPGSEAAPAFGDPKLQTNPCQQKECERLI